MGKPVPFVDVYPGREADDQPLKFGKYKGFTPTEVCQFSPTYIWWLDQHVRPRVCSAELVKTCHQEIRLRDAAKCCWDDGAHWDEFS